MTTRKLSLCSLTFALSLSLNPGIRTSDACVHNVDPSDVSSTGFAKQIGDGTYRRVESLSAKVLDPRKSPFKIYLAPAGSLVKPFQVVEGSADYKTLVATGAAAETHMSRFPIRTRGISKGIDFAAGASPVRVIIGDKEVATKIYKTFDAELFTAIAKDFDLDRGQSSDHKVNHELAHALKFGFWVVVASVKTAANTQAGDAAAIGLEFKSSVNHPLFGGYALSVFTLKALEFGMWTGETSAFSIEDMTTGEWIADTSHSNKLWFKINDYGYEDTAIGLEAHDAIVTMRDVQSREAAGNAVSAGDYSGFRPFGRIEIFSKAYAKERNWLKDNTVSKGVVFYKAPSNTQLPYLDSKVLRNTLTQFLK